MRMKFERELDKQLDKLIRQSFLAGFEFGFLQAKDGQRYWTSLKKAKEMLDEETKKQEKIK